MVPEQFTIHMQKEKRKRKFDSYLLPYAKINSKWVIDINIKLIWELLAFLTEKAMTTHSSTLAWKIPWTEKIPWTAWLAAVHGVTKSRTRLNDFTFTFSFHALEKEMATHSSVLAWRIPGTEQPGGLPSMGSHRVRHNWSDLAAATAFYAFIPLCIPESNICYRTLSLAHTCLSHSHLTPCNELMLSQILIHHLSVIKQRSPASFPTHPTPRSHSRR